MACPLVIWWLLCSGFWLFDGLLAPVFSDHVLAYNMQGTEVLLATAWLALRFAWPACWVGYLAIDGLMAGAADARCASRGETVPPLASLNVAALAERFNFFRPVAVVDVAAGRLAWRPSLFFSWCASMLLSMFRSLCFRATGVLAVVFLCFVRLGAVPSHWPVSRSVVAAIRAEWSKVQSSWLGHAIGRVLGLLDVAEGAPLARALRLSRLWHCPHGPAPLLALFRDISWPDLADGGVLGLLAVAEGAPPARDFRFARPGSARPLCAGCFLGLHLVPWLCPHWPSTAARWWLLDGWMRGFALMALPCRMDALGQDCFLGPASWSANFLFYKLSSLGQL
ncbi:hypothetical protein V6N11_056190 [Hibiscus sabdariffa]|uniref:Uncharacterized protein n=1 Tax=Hibiscus sabdariffa TaxID=183260 RepID=A0ABR2T3C1_9ROSI